MRTLPRTMSIGAPRSCDTVYTYTLSARVEKCCDIIGHRTNVRVSFSACGLMGARPYYSYYQRWPLVAFVRTITPQLFTNISKSVILGQKKLIAIAVLEHHKILIQPPHAMSCPWPESNSGRTYIIAVVQKKSCARMTKIFLYVHNDENI